VTAPQPCPIFLINLDRDADRLTLMDEALSRLGLTFERVPAILGVDMPAWLKPWFLDASGAIASTLKRGEVGCYASHLVVARRMAERGIPVALVFEDDLELPADLVELVTAMLAEAPKGWDIIRLSNPPKAAYLPRGTLPGGREFALYSRVPNNTGASLLSLAGARKLLRPGLRDLQIDEHLRRPWDLGLETYGVVPAPIRSNIFDTSTIEAMDARGLAGESALAKLRRRRIGTPGLILAQIRWQIAHLGAIGWLRAVLRGVAESVARKLGGRKAGAGAQTRWRLAIDRK
jgi:glycosyl transferase, family 25